VRGLAQFPAKVTDFIPPGTVFVPMHWGALWADRSEANAMTHNHCCPDSKQPELKACAVRLTKLAEPLAAIEERSVEDLEQAAALVEIATLRRRQSNSDPILEPQMQ
jgi:ferredoxin-nitrate reductase